ncbi:MAG: 8-oxo-dGTP diphosphatase MutT [Firmicutes bacterium]|nr:8-oxo-dGTP diphosphatase MutT [Bacillota bacterium]
MKTIRVAAAIIKKDNAIFATQRGYGEFKDYWEFPGGKIEPGESPEEALHREIMEELKVTVGIDAHLTRVEYDYPDFHLSMDCFLCHLESGELTLTEHEAARWLKTDELEEVGWLPADEAVVEMIRKEVL